MTEVYVPGQSIEGEKIDGDSRKPLLSRGLEKDTKGKRYFVYIASFNVNSEIAQECENLIFEEKAFKGFGDMIKCDRALIRTLAKKITNSHLTTGSATHQTNKWSFPDQTNVKIESPHLEIINAIEKRERITQQSIKYLV